MNKPDMSDSEKQLAQTGYIHIAFSLGNKEAVNELTHRLKDDAALSADPEPPEMDILKVVL